MNPRPARRRRLPRALLLLALLLLLLPLAPVDWSGALRFFRGGADAGPGGGASTSAPPGAGAEGPRFEWSAELPKLAQRARAGERAAEEARVGESWRVLANAIETAAAARDIGGARRTLAAAREGWLKEVPACAAAAEALASELESAAEALRRSELAAIEALLGAGDRGTARARLEAWAATGDESAFADIARLALAARGADPAPSADDRAREQALLWRRGSAGQPADALLRQAIGHALRAGSAEEIRAALELAHEIARCAYPARRVAEDLDGSGIELRWKGGAAAGAAALRERGGSYELRAPGSESFEPLRALEDPALAEVAVELFAPLGLEAGDARVALAAMLARAGDREAALRVLAVSPAIGGDERLRFLAALGS